MALRKFRFFAGACGPTVMYSNIVVAEDELAAVKKYLAATGEELTEERIQAVLRNIREIYPKEAPENLLDSMGRVISVGEDVLFIKGNDPSSPELLSGTVEKVTGKSIAVKDQNGDTSRVVLPVSEDDTLYRVLVMSPRPLRAADGVLDATGYPIQLGDKVANIGGKFTAHFGTFTAGVVEKISTKTIMVSGTRKNTDRVVVMNW